MGLGGYWTWTASMREISQKKLDQDTKIVPCEVSGDTVTRVVESPIFANNPYVYNESTDSGKNKFFLPMNIHETNYCKRDTPTKAHQRYDKHIIEQICEHYGIDDPDLRCELYFTKEEEDKVLEITKQLPKKYIVIEPHSKQNYTPNRRYPFAKWQNVVNSLKDDICFVQIGRPGHQVLDNVTSLLGKVSFRESALVIKNSQMFISTEGGLGHAANAVNKKSIIVLTGYQGYDMVAYPDNINIDISTHGPCGLKVECRKCIVDAEMHDEGQIIYNIRKELGLYKNEQ